LPGKPSERQHCWGNRGFPDTDCNLR
jgi:hypothetical protein